MLWAIPQIMKVPLKGNLDGVNARFHGDCEDTTTSISMPLDGRENTLHME
jgi:hypothetical protein